jgi:hypothetical protein
MPSRVGSDLLRSMRFKLRVPLALIGVALPVFAQYAGPAVLTRGEAPSGLVFPDLRFRPFLSVNGSYTTQLAGVRPDSQGEVPTVNTHGIRGSWGVSGAHSLRRTKIGLNYRGSYNHYYRRLGAFDSLDQTLMLGVERQLSRRISLSLNQTAGMVNRDFGLLNLSQGVPFDPETTSLPATDYFDNRTYHVSSQASLVIQRSARLSFNLGGGLVVTRRPARVLSGHTGKRAQGDVQYRLTRRITIGGNYGYGHHTYTRTIGSSIIQSAVGSFGMQLTRQTEFSGFAGVMRPEVKYLQSVPLDPVIQSLLGVSSGTRVVHRVFYTSYMGGRVSRTFREGVAFLSGSRGVNPGNGLFLTSITINVSGGYSYTGLRRWSFSIGGARTWADSIANVVGKYQTTSGRVGLSRTLRYGLHFTANYTVREYGSKAFANYSRVSQTATMGFSWSPGEVPLRIW